MAMYNFAYHRASSLADAASKLKAVSDARLLAGGMTLLPAMKLRLSSAPCLVDLRGLNDLRGTAVRSDRITIGAMTPHVEVASSVEVRSAFPALAKLAGLIGDPAVRNRGTIGGSVANNDPAADYPAAVLAAGVSVRTDRRVIAADKFFTSMFSTDLHDGEIITSIEFRVPEKANYIKFDNPASRFALVGVFVAKYAGDVRVAVTGAGPCVFRATEIEEALKSRWDQTSIDDVVVDPSGLNNDLHASAAYRAHLIKVLARRAVADS